MMNKMDKKKRKETELGTNLRFETQIYLYYELKGIYICKVVIYN